VTTGGLAVWRNRPGGANVHRFLELVKRWWRVIAAAAVLGGGLGFAAASPTDAYFARALVVATNPSVPPDQVSTVLQSIFPTDAVLEPTTSAVGIDASPRYLLSSGALSVEPGQSKLAVTIVGRARDPRLAVELANEAAGHLAAVADVNGFGTFAVFPWEGPATTQGAHVAVSVAVGAALAALLVLIGFLTWLAVRRSPARGEDVAYADAMYRLDVVNASNLGSHDGVVEPAYVVDSLWAALIGGRDRADRRIGAVVVGSNDEAAACTAVVQKLRSSSPTEGPQLAVLTQWMLAELPSAGIEVDALAIVAPCDTSLDELLELRRRLHPMADRLVILVLVSVIR
jgi:hypothetical protein